MNVYLKNFIRQTFENRGKALDLGAGGMRDVAWLKRGGWRAWGVDIKTGVDLENVYLSPDRPFDLVFSNYVLHKLRNRRNLIETARRNLKKDGWFFLHTFDRSDKNSSSALTVATVRSLLRSGFKKVSVRKFLLYDNEPGHKHWHVILEVRAQRSSENKKVRSSLSRLVSKQVKKNQRAPVPRSPS